MRYRTTCALLAFVSVLAVERTSYALTMESPARAWLEEPGQDVAASVAIVEAVPGGSSYADHDRVEGAVVMARIDLCHISHHPRDGLRPEQHACPLFIADARPFAPPLPLQQKASHCAVDSDCGPPPFRSPSAAPGTIRSS
jgi:hypothetical protein